MSSARDLRRHAAKVQAEARAARRPTAPSADRQAVFEDDPIAFAEALVNPETGEPFVLYEAERQFLREALTPTAAGALPYPELLFSAPKKSGKTTAAAIAVLYVVRVIGGRYAEGFCVANDFDQAAARVFRQAVRIIEASPLLRGTADVTADTITFPETGATITALPSDYAGAAGSNPAIVVFDELWAYTSERARRLWDELVPVPTRAVSVRPAATYGDVAAEPALREMTHRQGPLCAGIARERSRG